MTTATDNGGGGAGRAFSAADAGFMAHALRLARRGLYTASPNPRVGCVLVRDGSVVGEGWHRRAGEAHAEVNALAAAGESARGATAYVTLEPCNHHGRTGPCSEALASAGVVRVVAATGDPNPAVAGQGLARLAAAGVVAESGLLADAARRLNPGFLRRMSGGLPWVRVKLAASLDGRTAVASGESRWITGAASRRDVHLWRARSDGVLTGSGTALADDPRLTARDVDDEVLQPRRYLLDSALRVPATARIFAGDAPSVVYCAAGADGDVDGLAARGVAVRRLEADLAGRLPLERVVRDMAADGVNELLVEAGPTLAGAVLDAGLADELLLYQAPVFLGQDGRPLGVFDGIDRMARRRRLHIIESRRFGEDLRLTLAPWAREG